MTLSAEAVSVVIPDSITSTGKAGSIPSRGSQQEGSSQTNSFVATS